MLKAAVLLLALVGCLAGCGAGQRDSELVESHVKTFEGDDVEVRSCRRVGEAITHDSDYGATLHEAWKCAVKQLDSSPEFVDECYVVYLGLESGVIRGIRCASLGRGCPPGGRDGPGRTVFLGSVIDPDLVLERERGNDPAVQTVRVDVSHQEREGVTEHCGYLNVRVSATDDPTALAAEHVKRNGWVDPRYSFAYRLVTE